MECLGVYVVFATQLGRPYACLDRFQHYLDFLIGCKLDLCHDLITPLWVLSCMKVRVLILAGSAPGCELVLCEANGLDHIIRGHTMTRPTIMYTTFIKCGCYNPPVNDDHARVVGEMMHETFLCGNCDNETEWIVAESYRWVHTDVYP